MEKLRGLVERFDKKRGAAGAGSAGEAASADKISEILNTLPATKQWFADSPRASVVDLAETNASKAVHAHALVRGIDERTSEHLSSSTSLRASLSQLPTLRASAAAAGRQALALQTQLSELSSLIAEREAEDSGGARQEVEEQELADFETYARRRREEVEAKRRELDAQLQQFTRDRIGVLAEGSGENEGKRRGKGKAMGERLEKLSFDEEGEVLEDFFGESAANGDREAGSEKDEKGEKKESKRKREAKSKEKAEAKKKMVETPPPRSPAVKNRPHIVMDDEDIDEDMQDIWKKEFKR